VSESLRPLVPPAAYAAARRSRGAFKSPGQHNLSALQSDHKQLAVFRGGSRRLHAAFPFWPNTDYRKFTRLRFVDVGELNRSRLALVLWTNLFEYFIDAFIRSINFAYFCFVVIPKQSYCWPSAEFLRNVT